jgi:hypothetical protein
MIEFREKSSMGIQLPVRRPCRFCSAGSTVHLPLLTMSLLPGARPVIRRECYEFVI